jgi:23S rRNA pseudouridine1911/1915/1917 synthase
MPSSHHTLHVEQSHPHQRLDVYLREHLPTVSRGTIQRLIDEGHIRVNGLPTKATHAPRAGERIDIHWPEPKPLNLRPEDIPLSILHEDAELLVLNKPPGLVVHPAAGHDEHTLVNALLHHCRNQLSGIGGVERPGIVHRLDKDTSGCLVVAKTDRAHRHLAAQFEEREVEKLYDAIVCGELSALEGEVSAAIARHPSHRKRMAVTQGEGRAARTSYRVLERLQGATLVEAVLHTGRTHQIRVHFQHLRHPLVGDFTYGKRPNKRLAELTGYTAPRQMLHAKELSFTHPCTDELVTFEAPWPEDFRAALSALRSARQASAG